MTTATIELTQQLIQQVSVTPEDADCQPMLAKRLEAVGFEITNLPFDDVKNLWAVTPGTGPIFCFAGHTDVVPVGDESQWSYPPFAAQIHDGMLYGRGAADMKGSIAAMTVAVENVIKAKGLPNNARLAYLITSDEEGPAINGTVKVVNWLQENNIHLDYCLVGEPSSTKHVGDIIKNGRRGSLGATLTIHGKQGHVAYPHLAKNPIHLAAPALTEICAQQWDQGNDFFPATSFQISNINGGTGATNVIPGDLHIVCNFRFSTEVTAEQLQQRFEAILQKHDINYSIEWNLSGQPFLTAKGKLVESCVTAIEAGAGIETELSTSGGTSDGRFIAPMGTEVVELGPCNATIHQVDEHVSVEDLNTLTVIYQKLLENLLY